MNPVSSSTTASSTSSTSSASSSSSSSSSSSAPDNMTQRVEAATANSFSSTAQSTLPVFNKEYTESLFKLCDYLSKQPIETVANSALSKAQEQKEQSLKLLQQLLEKYDKEFSLDDLACLRATDAIPIFLNILLVLSLSKNKLSNENLWMFLAKFFRRDCRYTPQEENDLISAFRTLWNDCRIPSKEQAEYEQILKILLENKPILPKRSGTLKERQSALKLIAKLTRETSSFFEELWKMGSSWIKSVEKFESGDLQNLAQQKKEAKALKIPLKATRTITATVTATTPGVLSFSLEGNLCALRNSLLKQMSFYSQNRIPLFKYHFAQLDSSSPDINRQLETASSSVENCCNTVSQLAQKLTDYWISSEHWAAIFGGVDPESKQAKLLLRQTFDIQMEGQAKFFQVLADELQRALEVTSKTGGIPSTDVSTCLGLLSDSIKKDTPWEQRLNPFKKNSPSYLFVEHVLSKVLRNIEECKKTIDTHFAKMFSEDPLRRNGIMAPLLGLLDKLKNRFDSRIGSQHNNLFQTLINDIKEQISLTKKYSGSEESFKGWWKVNQENVAARWEKYRKQFDIPDLSKTSIFSTINMIHEQANSINWFGKLSKTLLGLSREIKEIADKESVVKGDSCLQFLELEEEAEAAKRAYERAEQAQKEALSKEAKKQKESMAKSSSSSSASSALKKTTKMSVATKPATVSVEGQVKSYYSTPAGKLLFEMRNELTKSHGLNPGELVLPSSFAVEDASSSELATHQQLYAYDCLIPAIEMLGQSADLNDKALLVQLVLQWGHLALEQGLTAEYVKVFPNNFTSHSLTVLLERLKINVNNLWTAEAGRYTLYHRYPWYYTPTGSQSLPFALKHIREANSSTTKQFCDSVPKWIEDAVVLQIAVLNLQSKQQPQIKRIEGVLASFLKEASVGRKEETQKTAEATPVLTKKAKKKPVKKTVLTGLEGELQKAFGLLNSRLGAEPRLSLEATKALGNAKHHLFNLKGALGLLRRFPQQRFMHVLLKLMHFSVKNFAENLGVFLSLQNGVGCYTHALKVYQRDFNLGEGLSKELLGTLDSIDVWKGVEYPYTYFATHSKQEISTLMETMNEFYVRSKEAEFLGEGATPVGIKKKNEEALKKELFDIAKCFVDLTCALAEKHLKG